MVQDVWKSKTEVSLVSILLFDIPIEIWALFISIVAILITLAKDFILPWFFKPKLIFKYKESTPFRRENITVLNESRLGVVDAINPIGTFLRFMVKNKGNRPAINCRCQILSVRKNGGKYGDYQGFPLKWASRPESVINQASGERLNIARGESEFVDVAYATNQDSFIHLQKYHTVVIGIKEVIEAGEYDIILVFSGDNFKPYKIRFHIKKDGLLDPNSIKLELINFWN